MSSWVKRLKEIFKEPNSNEAKEIDNIIDEIHDIMEFLITSPEALNKRLNILNNLKKYYKDDLLIALVVLCINYYCLGVQNGSIPLSFKVLNYFKKEKQTDA